jgi:CheY-like chemotaxis protein
VSSGRILVIDDSEVMLARIKKALVAEGYEVTTTTRAVGNARYLPTSDLVIIDYHMPGIDGETVIQALRGSSGKMEHDDPAKVSKDRGETAKEPAANTRRGGGCLFYLYTSDPAIAHSYARLGFDGCLNEKGDEASLVRQVGSIFRLRKIRALAERSRRPPAPDAEAGRGTKSKLRGKP